MLTAGDPVAAMISTFLDSEGLAALPPPRWLIKDWVPLEGLVQTVGQPEHGKSFVALDQAMHVALGRAWHGHRVEKVRVGYLVAEGASGMGQRVKAWQKRFNESAPVEDISFIPYPIQVSDHALWDLFIAACVRMRFGYLVVDTQARVTVGMEENSAKEMGMFVEQVERLRRATRATVNIVHHQGKSGGTARGSGAMLGAVHTEITVSRTENRVTAMVTKQKDAEKAKPLTLQLVSEKVGYLPIEAVEGGWTVNAVAEPVWAGVLMEVDAVNVALWATQEPKEQLLTVLRDVFPEHGATQAQTVSEAVSRGMSRSAAYRAWSNIWSEGKIRKVFVNDKETGRYVCVPLEERISSSEA